MEQQDKHTCDLIEIMIGMMQMMFMLVF